MDKWSCLQVIFDFIFLTSFLNSNNLNWAVFLFVQMPFDMAKQSVVMGRVLTSFAGVG